MTLRDGFTVTYQWYRFADQPALQGWNLGADRLNALQSIVEKMHQAWPIDRDHLAPPSRGSLVSQDGGQIVSPPPGLELGYVPIVTSQLPAVACGNTGACPPTNGCHRSLCSPLTQTCVLDSDTCLPPVAVVTPPAGSLPDPSTAATVPDAPTEVLPDSPTEAVPDSPNQAEPSGLNGGSEAAALCSSLPAYDLGILLGMLVLAWRQGRQRTGSARRQRVPPSIG